MRVGLAARLRAWAESEGAERARAGGVRLSALLRDGGVTALSMPAAADPAQVARWAQLLARGCLQAAAGRTLARPALLIIDEAQFAGGPALSAILQQGRGLGLYVVLAFQEAETAYATLGPAWANPQTIIVGRQGDRESAERAAWLFGTRRERLPRWGIEAAGLGTERHSDVGSEQWQDVMAVNPQAIRELRVGQFYLLSRAARSSPRLARVMPGDEPWATSSCSVSRKRKTRAADRWKTS